MFKIVMFERVYKTIGDIMATDYGKGSLSFAGWSIVEFVKGRRRSITLAVAGLLAYWISDSEMVALLSGIVVESGIAVVEYYVKKR